MECKRAEKLLKEGRQRQRAVNEVSLLSPPEDDTNIPGVEAMTVPNRNIGNGNGAGNHLNRNIQYKTHNGNFQQPHVSKPPDHHTIHHVVTEKFCQSPFHLNLCFTCGMPGDFYRRNDKEIRPENKCRSSFHEMSCFACGMNDSFCTYVPKNPQVAEMTGNCCQTAIDPEFQ